MCSTQASTSSVLAPVGANTATRSSTRAAGRLSFSLTSSRSYSGRSDRRSQRMYPPVMAATIASPTNALVANRAGDTGSRTAAVPAPPPAVLAPELRRPPGPGGTRALGALGLQGVARASAGNAASPSPVAPAARQAGPQHATPTARRRGPQGRRATDLPEAPGRQSAPGRAGCRAAGTPDAATGGVSHGPARPTSR